METFILSISRVGSFMSRHVPYEIWFRGEKMGRITGNEQESFTIGKIKGVLRIQEIGSKYAFHRIYKEVVIYPEYITDSRQVRCEVSAKLNWIGVLTGGLFAPVRTVNISLKY